tara:strand:- start:174 stop:926 length:753 start_codon:yes stop_codon:yes gene_type:complete
MISRELAINLGITLVFSIGLFVYFNSKVNKVENKINAVFKIIQQHNNNNNNNNMEYMSPSNEQQNMGEFMQINEVLEEKNDLVEISDDEDSSEEESGNSEDESGNSEDESGDDSDEESDKESDDNEKKTQNEEEKKVSLSDDNEDIDLNIETVEAKDEKDNIEQVTIEPPSTINISELLAKKSDEQKKKVDENDDLSDVGDFDDEDHEKTDKPLAKWTVKELQDYAATKNLKKYKSLTKPKLIELIENAE